MTTWPNGRALTQQAGLSGWFTAGGANVGLQFTDRDMGRMSSRFVWSKDAVPTGYSMEGILAKSDGYIGYTSTPYSGVGTANGAIYGTGLVAGSGSGIGQSTNAGAAQGTIVGGSTAGSSLAVLTSYAKGVLGAVMSIGSRPTADDAAEATVGKNIVGLDLSVGEAIALIVRLLRNKQITDPATGEVRVYADDDTTVLLAADLWKDSDGTTPYSGTGADRRERLQ